MYVILITTYECALQDPLPAERGRGAHEARDHWERPNRLWRGELIRFGETKANRVCASRPHAPVQRDADRFAEFATACAVR